MRLLEHLSPPKDDQRGVYSIFLVIMMPILIVVLGVAIDGPRQLTVRQRAGDVAEQAARYAAGLVVTDEGDFERVRELTNNFVSSQSSGTFGSRNLQLERLNCDAETGEIVATVTGTLLNTFSGLIFGVERSFRSTARAGLFFSSAGGAPLITGGDEIDIDICSLNDRDI